MLPNALSPIVVAVTFGIPQIIFAEAALSFIGVGINPPMPSWGQMVGSTSSTSAPTGTWPSSAIAIALTMLSFTFLGDGLRDALDPRTTTSSRGRTLLTHHLLRRSVRSSGVP